MKHASFIFTDVPYSLHSSYEELQLFVKAIRPRQLYSTVRGSHAQLLQQFGELLDPSPAVYRFLLYS